MKVLELMHGLEEAYHRFGDIDITVHISNEDVGKALGVISSAIKELIIESEEFTIKCGK